MESVGLFKICHEKPNYTEVEQMQNARLILPICCIYTQQEYIVIKKSTDQKTKEEIVHKYLYFKNMLGHPQT